MRTGTGRGDAEGGLFTPSLIRNSPKDGPHYTQALVQLCFQAIIFLTNRDVGGLDSRSVSQKNRKLRASEAKHHIELSLCTGGFSIKQWLPTGGFIKTRAIHPSIRRNSFRISGKLGGEQESFWQVCRGDKYLNTVLMHLY